MLRPVPPKRPKAPERAPSVGSATRSRQKNGLGASSYTASSLCGRGAGGTHLPVLVEVPVRHHVVVLHHRGHPKSSLTSAGRSGILCVHATQVWIDDESVVVFIIAHTNVPASPCPAPPPRPTGPKRESRSRARRRRCTGQRSTRCGLRRGAVVVFLAGVCGWGGAAWTPASPAMSGVGRWCTTPRLRLPWATFKWRKIPKPGRKPELAVPPNMAT